MNEPEIPASGEPPVEPPIEPLPEAPPSPPRPAMPMGPVAAGERVEEMDLVRGFALLGILLMNIEYFFRPLGGIMLGFDETLTGADRVTGWLVATFVQGKFYTLFSMLFGMGFAIQMARAGERGASFPRFFARRLAALALIGAVHGYLIWAGDILLVYALSGFALLLLFRKTPVGRLPKWGLALIFLPLLAMWGMVSGLEMARQDPTAAAEIESELAADRAEMHADYDHSLRVHTEGSFVEVLAQRAVEMNHQLGFAPFFGWGIVGMFLLGVWLVRSGRMVRPADHLGFFRLCFRIGLPLGALLAVVAMFSGAGDGMDRISWRLAVGGTLMQVASLLLTFGYLAAIVLLAQNRSWRARLAPMAAAGRMALTNYLLQSLLMTAISYPYGFGLFDQVPRALQIPLALAVWGLNLAFSVWWLARFRFGPAEWLWRTLTYGQAQPMRR